MKRWILIVAALLICMQQSSYAQGDGQSGMPEKVRESLEKLIGSWKAKGFTEGKAEYKWDLSRTVVIGSIEFETDDTTLVYTSQWYWDGESDDGIVTSRMLFSDHGVLNTEFRGKVLPGGIVKGRQTGKDFSDNLRVEHQSPNQFTIFATNIVEGGERIPDVSIIFTRVDPTGRGDTTSTEQVLARNKEQVKRFYAAFSKQDLTQASKVITPSFREWLKPRFGLIKSNFSEFKITPGEMVTEGNTVAVLWSESAIILPGVLPEKDKKGPGTHWFISNGCSFYKLTEDGLLDGVRIVQGKDKIVNQDPEKEQAQNGR